MNLAKSVRQLVVSINMAPDEFDANNPVSDVGCCFTLPCLLPTWIVCLLRSRRRLLPSDRGRSSGPPIPPCSTAPYATRPCRRRRQATRPCRRRCRRRHCRRRRGPSSSGAGAQTVRPSMAGVCHDWCSCASSHLSLLLGPRVPSHQRRKQHLACCRTYSRADGLGTFTLAASVRPLMYRSEASLSTSACSLVRRH